MMRHDGLVRTILEGLEEIETVEAEVTASHRTADGGTTLSNVRGIGATSLGPPRKNNCCKYVDPRIVNRSRTSVAVPLCRNILQRVPDIVSNFLSVNFIL